MIKNTRENSVWSDGEIGILERYFKDGLCIEELSKIHLRSEGSIKIKLEEIGWLASLSTDANDSGEINPWTGKIITYGPEEEHLPEPKPEPEYLEYLEGVLQGNVANSNPNEKYQLYEEYYSTYDYDEWSYYMTQESIDGC